MNEDLCFLTAAELLPRLKNKETSVSDVANSCLRRIELLNDKFKPFVFFDRNIVESQVTNLSKKTSDFGKLYGIPVAIKDVFNTFDMPTEMGSSIWKGFTPGNDARSIFHIRQEDVLVMGKTVTAEFAVHAEGETFNPHNIDYSPGTSSSGSAVAVATYMVPLALGTQTGGSIIRPASYCGIYGFKPTFGLIPRVGMLKTTDTLDTVGFFSRSVDDLRLMLDSIRVKGKNYPSVNNFLESSSRQLKTGGPWKVALVKSHVWDHAEDYAKESLLNFASKLSENKDIVVEEVELPPIFEKSHDTHTLIYDKTLSYYFNKEYSESIGGLSEILKNIISKGNEINLESYREAINRQVDLVNELDSFFENYDFILTLSTSGQAPKKGVLEKKDTSLIWTLCGNPSVNLPVFKSPISLPFGAQVVARKYNDYFLLNFLKFLKNEGYLRDGTYPDLK